MDNQSKLYKIEIYVKQTFTGDSTGHDYYHMQRVAKMAKKIAIDEDADPFITESAAWLHDIGDKKLFSNPEVSIQEMEVFLNDIGLSENQVKAINVAMRDVSFSKGHEKPKTLEGQIVQDADRLDAIGAIGIARAFAFGGAHNRLIHTEDKPEQATASIQHFYDKLLHLKDLLNTSSAKLVAEERHEIMVRFLKQFYKEWNIEE